MSNDIQSWELTAFALGELPFERARQVELAIAADPKMASELAALCSTIGQVTAAMNSEAMNSEALSSSSSPSRTLGIAQSLSQLSRRRTWLEILGLSATAASFLVAGFYTNELLFHAPTDEIALKVNSMELKSGTTEIYTLEAKPQSESSDSGAKTGNEGEIVEETLQKGENLLAAVSDPGSASFGSVTSSPAAGGDHPFHLEKGVAEKAIAMPKNSSMSTVVLSPNGFGGAQGIAAGSGSEGYGLMRGLEGGQVDSYSGYRSKGKAASPGPTPTPIQATTESMPLMSMATPHIAIPESEVTEALLTDRAENEQLSLAKRLSDQTRDNRTSGDRFDPIIENEFQIVEQNPFSTFSIDVDSASYSKTRQYLLEANELPQPSSVRIEELINYFQYNYQGPTGDLPFSSALAVADAPWNPSHRLVRIALQAKKIENEKRPVSNLVFLLDVSGSMNEPNKLPLVKESMRMLIKQLGENDRVAMVVYAGAAGVVLDSTTGDKREKIMEALDKLSAGGSTNGGAGIQAAYQIARENFIPGGTNRIILCTDGDFNVGVTSNAALVDLVEENAKSKVFLTVLGYGMGNSNDSMMEQITNRGNGLYGFVDSELEARRMMVEQLAGSLITVAKDVKVQVEFNPQHVAGYRLIGYENRILATQDFNNDKKDAGEIGAGHCVTALYEIVPAGEKVNEDVPPVDTPRYQVPKQLTPLAKSEELLVVKLRYKQPEGDKSSLLEFPCIDSKKPLKEMDTDFRWAASMAQFGMLLRNSKFKGDSNWDALLETAEAAAEDPKDGYRQQALEMIRAARKLSTK